MKRAVLFTAALFLLSAVAPSAFAHGDEVKTTPKKGSRVNAIPAEVTVSLSEDPTNEAVLKIRDGCGNNAVADVTVSGDSIVAAIGDAQPGKWTASWRAISSVDGHATDGDFAFTVAGKKDCSPDEPSEESEGDTSQGDASSSNVQAGGSSNGDGPAPADEGSSFPVVPVVVGAGALIGLAFIARSAGAR